MENLDDILEGCREQDKASQQKLYARFYPAFFSLCKTFFKDKHDTLTAVNNGMLNVFKNIRQYDEAKGEFFSWAYSIVRNSALTLVLRKKKMLTHEINENMLEFGSYNPFKQLEWKDIYIALDQLPPATRCVCSLFYIEGYSIREISNSIELSEGTVKWHLSECRRRLKLIFEKNSNIEKSA